MHDTAYEIGCAFLQTYRLEGLHRVVEIGSMNLNGSIRDRACPESVYLGLDVDHGRDVDIVIDPLRPLPLRSGFADLVVSSSQMEHDTFFWNTFLEMLRITRDGGYIYVNTPSNGYYHRHPLDCWRLYPDAGIALTRWARHSGFRCTLIESFIAHRRADVWNDFVGIFQKCDEAEARAPGFLSEMFPADNVHKLGGEAVAQESGLPEDMRLREAAEQARQERDHLRAASRTAAAELAELREREAALSEEIARLTAAAEARRDAEVRALADASPEPELVEP